VAARGRADGRGAGLSGARVRCGDGVGCAPRPSGCGRQRHAIKDSREDAEADAVGVNVTRPVPRTWLARERRPPRVVSSPPVDETCADARSSPGHVSPGRGCCTSSCSIACSNATRVSAAFSGRRGVPGDGGTASAVSDPRRTGIGVTSPSPITAVTRAGEPSASPLRRACQDVGGAQGRLSRDPDADTGRVRPRWSRAAGRPAAAGRPTGPRRRPGAAGAGTGPAGPRRRPDP
jgi:hypothetical protein